MSRNPSRPDLLGTGAVRELVIAKLATSGLTAADGVALGVSGHARKEVTSLDPSFDPAAGLRLPYWEPLAPDVPAAGWPKAPPFFRLRYLEEPVGFGKDAKELKRYVQPTGSVSCVYFPRLLALGWAKVLGVTSNALFVTEGELKAAKACKAGYATIGLGGVDAFRASKAGFLVLPDLERIVWPGRTVYVCYDSDTRTNPNVARALQALGDQLRDLGAFPYVATCPDVTGREKTGLDDLLVAQGDDAMLELVRHAQPFTLARPLWRLNERVAYVRDPGLVVDLASSQKMTPSAFQDHAFSAAVTGEARVDEKGNVSLKPVSAAKAWLAWPLREEVDRLTYAPGQGRRVQEGLNGHAVRCLNTWVGWGLEPRKGDHGPFLRLVDHLFKGADPADRLWFLRWLAYPLRQPGAKLFSSVLLYGWRHGTGKSLVGYTMAKIYGANFAEIKQSDLHASFNEWAEAKQFVLGDEITGTDKRADADMLKRLITQQQIRINLKHVPSFVVPDRINYLFTSNHPDAFFLEDTDRRFFVHEVLVDPLPEDFYVDYALWLDGDGPAGVFRYLLDLDLGDFQPGAPARRTAAKVRMTLDVKSDLGAWAARLAEDPAAVLKLGDVAMGLDLYTNQELLRCYDPLGRTKVTANGLGRELKKAGFRQALDGRPIRANGAQDRYYVVRHAELWATASHDDLATHLEGRPVVKKDGRKRK